jgi:hypothetical protein
VDGVPHSAGHQGSTHRSRGLNRLALLHFVHPGFPPLFLEVTDQHQRLYTPGATTHSHATSSAAAGSPAFSVIFIACTKAFPSRIGAKDVTDDR